MTNFEQKIKKLFALADNKHYGISEQKITSTESKLNIKIPDVLRNFYLLFGKNKKLNINDFIFKVKDIYIEDDQYLIFGKGYWSGKYGISINDTKKRNPVVYHRIMKRDINHKRYYEWVIINSSLENFLFEKIIQSGLFGGFKYRFSLESNKRNLPSNNQSQELTCDEAMFDMDEIKELSIQSILSSSYRYYTCNYCYIMEIHWENDNNLIEYINFSTENREIFNKFLNEFNKRGLIVKIEKNNYSDDYQIYDDYFHGPTVEFSPGEYKFDPMSVSPTLNLQF